MPTSPPDGSIERLNFAIANILDPQDSRAFSFKPYIKNRIRQYNLTNHLDPNEVINEAYKRAIAAVESGKVVEHWQAWLKSTCLNIVRERSRDRQRHPSIDPQSPTLAKLLVSQARPICDRSEEESRLKEIQKQLKLFSQALEEYAKVEPESARLLELKLVHKWSWQRIREYLLRQNQDGTVPSLSVLRKRASRAKTKMRHLYHRLEEEQTKATII